MCIAMNTIFITAMSFYYNTKIVTDTMKNSNNTGCKRQALEHIFCKNDLSRTK